ncbi:DUF3006 domain-containing protein [Methanosphaerula subterraneus]|uniref:DUF3006 domain-containing protein n=1 Tax=Methanosphaerula subterraneus TaxID=3350244 RepID=UPI003F84A281
MKVTVDRFEGEIAVLLVRPEETQQILFPRELLPGVEEGDILEITATREIRETEEARARVSSLIEKLRQKGT